MRSGGAVSIGDPLVRVDGRAKVTGTAKYSAEFSIPGLTYAALVMSTVPSGRVTRMDTREAESAPGVLAVITPFNAMRLAAPERRLTLLQDDKVFYDNQPIGVVVAETIEQARYGASLVRSHYAAGEAKLNFKAGFAKSYPGEHNGEPGDQSWGDAEGALRHAEVKVDRLYTTPIHHHNPMEPHATIAQWDGDRVTIHDATQHVSGVKEKIAKIFGVPKEGVHVISLFAGGGFGCKGQVWSHVPIAVLAAKQVKRPVKLVLERDQMFGPVGARPMTYQQVALGATREGKLTAIRHVVHTNTSLLEDYLESAAFPTRVMYACPNISTVSRLVQLNMGTPTYARAPGVATGTFAVEVAMDEMAYELKQDPLAFRLLNYAEVDPHSGEPFTEKHLRECYARGAEKFGWSRRSFEPRSMREGKLQIGWGMATETYPGKNMPASALVRLMPNGRVVVASGTQEIGTGNYTLMTQVVSDVLRVPVSMIDARLGDTALPEAPISAGSMSTASVMPAVKAAAEQVKQKLAEQGHRGQPIEAMASTKPQLDFKKVPCHSFGAIFAEVAVDPDLGMTRVRRVVAVYDVGRIVNALTARSQFIGGIVWGISLALHEETEVDWRHGRIVNRNLAEYRVPVNADIPDIDVSALDIPDYRLDTLGSRGVGEIGITGTGAAVANAVFHATGKRVRDLPILERKDERLVRARSRCSRNT